MASNPADEFAQYAVNANTSSPADEFAQYIAPSANAPAAPTQAAATSSPTSLGDAGWDILARFGKGAYQATNFLPGLLSTKNSLADQMYGAIPPAKNIGQMIPEAVGSAAPTLAFSAPYIAAAKAAGVGNILANLLGYGAFSGSKSVLQGNSDSQVLKDSATGAATGGLSSLLGTAGQNITSRGANLLSKFIGSATNSAPKVISPIAVKVAGTAMGQAAGGGASSALQGGSPQDILNNSIVQGGLGALTPSKVVSQDQYEDQIAQNGKAYKTLLHPTASVIKKVEGGFSDKDINDSYNLMAKVGVPIIENNGNLDTRPAQQQLTAAIQPMVQAKQQMLATNQSPQFNLNDIRTQALAQLNQNKSLDPLSLSKAAEDINTHINAAISDPRGQGINQNGQGVDALKSQLYGVGYSELAPTSEIAAKQIASVIKNNLENSYSTLPLKQVNDTIGKYAAASNLLANAHGTKVTPTKNTLPAAIAGAAAGAGLSAATNMLGAGSPLLDSVTTPMGAAGGATLNELIQRAHNDPERVTKLLKNRLDSLTVK